MRIGTRREPALVLLFMFLTCHVYTLYYIYKVSEETQEFLGESDVSPGVHVLLTIITCGLWNIFWDYQIGKKIAQMNTIVGLPPSDNAVLYVILDLLGAGGLASVGILNPLIQQDALNRIWDVAMMGNSNMPRYSNDPGAWPPPPAQ